MKYLWIGVCLSDEQREFIINGGGKILSANVSQDALLAGLEQNGHCFDSINAQRLPYYPAFPHKNIPEFRWSRNGISSDVSVGYKNVKYLAHMYKTKSLRHAAKAWAKENKGDDVTVLVYSMHSPFMACAAEIKKIIPNAKINLIVPDLPQFMDLHMSKVKKLLKAFDWRKIRKYMKSVDKYILYSKHMAEFLHLKNGSWMVMEGSFDPSLIVDETPEKQKNKLPIMYSGVLDTRYGIPELLDAFSMLDDRFELWFTGTGNAVNLINQCAEKDARIHNFGFLPSRRDLLLKQKEAAMLISTRRPDEKASDYCFPSKLFEYMISGNPVLSCRIGGIPDEYFDHLIEMKSTHPLDIKEAILAVAEMTEKERALLGNGAREFILNEKSNIAQAKKIIEFVAN